MNGVSETQVKNFLTNNVWPDVRDIIITKLDNNFDPGYTLFVSLRVADLPGNTWEIYPKFIISGTTDLTKQQLRNGFDSTLDNIKDVIKPHMIAQGATNISYHIHKSTGSFDVTE